VENNPHGRNTDRPLIRVLSEDTPFQGPGRWSLLLYLLQDKKLKENIRKLAMELKDKIERNKYRRTKDNNPQTLHKTFKDEVAKIGRQRAKEMVPALKRDIENLVTQRKVLVNDPRLSP
jgi:DNA topoisomerase VI subunit B